MAKNEFLTTKCTSSSTSPPSDAALSTMLSDSLSVTAPLLQSEESLFICTVVCMLQDSLAVERQ
eukprot:CAMPEP_0177456196 /NCGR_PEP_ID=MMETSP0369-20130122/12308_1 /TAXON_ID=447022 ORGANISM="Scrippsiella hangoei-like, Strain SHHI-4" /NCGR_SAMPLE_ID=MMETSP0369 /ASSEMBLY_ACC=CAM_ASM_000364 /LENGTH=63 /DNA_ID=CAMNT_0018929111 /DNA_START=660 /DNA_END=848 /DNA_ORIENTATION=+